MTGSSISWTRTPQTTPVIISEPGLRSAAGVGEPGCAAAGGPQPRGGSVVVGRGDRDLADGMVEGGDPRTGPARQGERGVGYARVELWQRHPRRVGAEGHGRPRGRAHR